MDHYQGTAVEISILTRKLFGVLFPELTPGECKLKDIPEYKIVLIGDSYVGKSSIFLRYIHNQFNFDYHPTKRLGLENVVKKVNLPRNSLASIALWDVPGRDDIDLTETYYRNVDAAVVVVDMNDTNSINLAGVWKQDFVNKTSRCELVPDKSRPDRVKIVPLPCDPQTIPVLLLGNKFDLVEEVEYITDLRDLDSPDLNSNSDDDVNNEIDPQNRQASTAQDDDVRQPLSVKSRKEPDQPECVQLLTQVEKQHGFVGSVAVSARESDGSVQDALQALVRHLIDRSLPPRPTKIIEAEKIKKEKKTKMKHMTETGVEELDKLFLRCELPVQKVVHYVTYYDLVLKKFRQTCADYGFLNDIKGSLEDCVIGLREALKESLDFCLTSQDDEGFITLHHEQPDVGVKVPREITLTLEQFNKQYSTLCKMILNDSPYLDNLLLKLDSKIEKRCDELHKLLPEDSDREKTNAVIDTCDRNRAVLSTARTHVEKLVRNVQGAYSKVTHALIW